MIVLIWVGRCCGLITHLFGILIGAFVALCLPVMFVMALFSGHLVTAVIVLFFMVTIVITILSALLGHKPTYQPPISERQAQDPRYWRGREF